MVLLILIGLPNETIQIKKFKFQYVSTDTKNLFKEMYFEVSFKFQYGSTDTNTRYGTIIDKTKFKFQYGSTDTFSKQCKK